jgi:hypothetical protein
MAETGTRKMKRPLALWYLGGAVFLITGVVILKNLNKENLLATDSDIKSIELQAKLPNRNTSNELSLLEAHGASSNANNKITASEEMISQIVASERPVHDKAADLLELLPESKGSEQTLVASHLSNVAEGEQLDKLVSYLSDPRINKKSKEEIFNAIFECKKPKQRASLLIQTIEAGVQEFAGEAETALSILLNVDHGANVAAWKAELSKTGDSLEADEIGQ